MCVCVCSIYHGFIPMFSALTTFPPERSVVAKERAAKSYPISSYFLARSFSDLPIQLVYPLVFLCIVYPLVGMPWTAADVLVGGDGVREGGRGRGRGRLI